MQITASGGSDLGAIQHEQLPHARRVIDRYHVVRMASTALEKIRIDFQKSMTKSERLLMKKGIRWSLLKGPDNRSNRDWELIEHIRQSPPKLATAFDLKEEFSQIYECTSRKTGCLQDPSVPEDARPLSRP